MERFLEVRQREAEEVRAHLVMLRGGAPFLSPRDSALLERWLDDGVTVPTILVALERAADARRRRKTRAPLELAHAKRHLGKPTGGKLSAKRPSSHPLGPVCDRLEQSGEPALAAVLRELDTSDPDLLVRGAVGLVRAFVDARVGGLSDEDRAALRAEALEELGELAGSLTSSELEDLLDEGIRRRVRATWPWLTTATFLELVHGPG